MPIAVPFTWTKKTSVVWNSKLLINRPLDKKKRATRPQELYSILCLLSSLLQWRQRFLQTLAINSSGKSYFRKSVNIRADGTTARDIPWGKGGSSPSWGQGAAVINKSHNYCKWGNTAEYTASRTFLNVFPLHSYFITHYTGTTCNFIQLNFN